jgi:excisionase family DNA binding protein
MREVMTPEQVAQYLQLNIDTIYRLIRQHKLAAAKIGRSYRIPRDDLETFLMTHSNKDKVRQAMFARVLSIAERNAQQYPDLSSDDILEELESMDEERKHRQDSKA